jgi:hypothetical protein
VPTQANEQRIAAAVQRRKFVFMIIVLELSITGSNAKGAIRCTCGPGPALKA